MVKTDKKSLDAMKYGNVLQRIEAVQAMKDVTDAAGVEGLISGAKDQLPTVRSHAAESLASAKGEGVGFALEALAFDPYPAVRKAAVTAMGERGSPKSIKAILRLVDDPHVGVRYSAALALGKIKVISEDGEEALFMLLQDRDLRIREAAHDSIEIFPEHYRAMHQSKAKAWFESGDSQSRAAGVRLSYISGVPGWTDIVEKAIVDPSPIVRVDAVRVAVRSGDQGLAFVLLQGLVDQDWLTRAEAWEGVKELGLNKETAQQLLIMISGESPILAQSLIELLAEIDPKKYWKRVRNLVSQPSTRVLRALLRMEARATEEHDASGRLMELLRASPEAASEFMRHLKGAHVTKHQSELMQLVASSPWYIRRAFVSIINNQGFKKPEEVLAMFLADSHPLVRYAALREAPGVLGTGKQLMKTLVQLSADPHQSVRSSAVRLMTKVQQGADSNRAAVLSARQNDESSTVRCSVAFTRGFVRRTNADKKGLQYQLADPKPKVIQFALNAIGRAMLTDLIESVKVLTKHDNTDVRNAAIGAAAMMGDRDTELHYLPTVTSVEPVRQANFDEMQLSAEEVMLFLPRISFASKTSGLGRVTTYKSVFNTLLRYPPGAVVRLADLAELLKMTLLQVENVVVRLQNLQLLPGIYDDLNLSVLRGELDARLHVQYLVQYHEAIAKHFG